MLQYINHNGKQLPIDFNIKTLVCLAKVYNTSITGLSDVFYSFKDEADSIAFIANVGAVALSEGSRRAGGAATYTDDDIYDMLTVDISLAEKLIDMLFATMQSSQVFPKAATATMPPKKKSPKRKR
jgi:hypothetical protein